LPRFQLLPLLRQGALTRPVGRRKEEVILLQDATWLPQWCLSQFPSRTYRVPLRRLRLRTCSFFISPALQRGVSVSPTTFLEERKDKSSRPETRAKENLNRFSKAIGPALKYVTVSLNRSAQSLSPSSRPPKPPTIDPSSLRLPPALGAAA